MSGVPAGCEAPAAVHPHAFSPAERAAVYRAMALRRDMRHFLPDPLDDATLRRLLWAAHAAPSVGHMQPWRLLRVTDPAVRAALRADVEAERLATAQALGARGGEFLHVKVHGLDACPELWVAALADGREAHLFGRRTLPEMDLASVACALQNLWLAARAEGVGMGWVSLFDPDTVSAAVHLPPGARPVALICLGRVPAFYDQPLLVQADWAPTLAPDAVMFENTWGSPALWLR